MSEDESLQAKRAAYKQPGKTLAESLGIDVPADAPGGHKLGVHSPRSKAPGHYVNEAEYQGFGDVDGYNHPNGDD